MKIAICIPRYGDTKGEFTVSLARMIAFSLGLPSSRALQIEILSTASSDLPGNRAELLRAALQWQARYLLWLDCDHVFPPDTLMRLLQHSLPVVGCNQPRRTNPTGPVAVRRNADGELEHVYTTEETARAGLVEEVYHVGLALCLMDLSILQQVKARLDEKDMGWNDWEPFARKPIPGRNLRMSEDVSFFRELTDAGIKVYIDHALSWEVGHIADRILTNADAVAQRDVWLSRNS